MTKRKFTPPTEFPAEYVRADRIEELEAKLALAIETIDEAIYFADIEVGDILKGAGCYRIAKAMRDLNMCIPVEWVPALDRMKELTGGKDE